ncbi:glycosyltransferase family 90 protein [Durotheca rogersii]|uniref:glycosyltransferase family 90 protein n=1 Tax=Durotheca rogersii TaxID=419775 RepID=UPI00221E9885|nr:glycosyltransferase family 90 protein [Durotheca rogersii]KAI5859829.1 glycosyltransferase family 90 protein [Durotheca rogersii]
MRSPAFPPRRPSHLVRYALPALLILGLFYYLSHTPREPRLPNSYASPGGHPLQEHPYSSPDSSQHETPDVVNQPGQNSPSNQKLVHGDPDDSAPAPEPKPPSAHDPKPAPAQPIPPKPASPPHAIDELIKVAEKDYENLLAKESKTLSEAAAAYRKRRGRHPPPGFDKWYNFAKENNALLVEDFFDQIYHDLNPFWGVDPLTIRTEASGYEMIISIRNGNASAESDWFWTQIWLGMIQTIEHLLPDMDVALNAMDEPRLVVPWEDINAYMKKEKQSRVLSPVKSIIKEFKSLPPPVNSDDKSLLHTINKDWEKTNPYWLIARRGCPPDSPARKAAVLDSFDVKPSFSSSWATPHQYEGYVSNSTLASEFCHQPDLQGLEGIFIRPLTTSATKVLFPMFGGSKLATNNEILLPAPMYWNEEERFTGGDDHGPSWDEKKDSVIWRGVATGGRNTESNWRGFQRHRFVSMNNGTKLQRAEEGIEPPVNFELPSATYDLVAQKEKRLGAWVTQWSDVGFTDLFCDPEIEPKQKGGRCVYTDKHFKKVPGEKLAAQFRYKYLPDIDGNSFSGRYLGFLRSTSLPIKSTLWREWHDSRLVAWKHFVPMDNRFGDFYGIMQYFYGYEGIVSDHDGAARKIAMDGKAWAEKVLRKEDMQIYVLRLLLEYARISDDRRENMGWADDLIP